MCYSFDTHLHRGKADLSVTFHFHPPHPAAALSNLAVNTQYHLYQRRTHGFS
jgi:hypothetical protein